MARKLQKTIAMDPIAAAFEEIYEKSPIPKMFSHIFTGGGNHLRHPLPLPSTFKRPPQKPKKKFVLQSLKKLTDGSSVSEDDLSFDKTSDSFSLGDTTNQKQSNQENENVAIEMACEIMTTTIDTNEITTVNSPKDINLINANKDENEMENNRVAGNTSSGSQNGDCSKVYILTDWNIKPVPQCRGVVVEGKLHGSNDDVLWHSSPVSKRIQTRTLISSTGSTYKLKGRMNHAATMEAGFILPIALKFRNGFPSDWLEAIKEYYDYIESNEYEESFSRDERSLDVKTSDEKKSLVGTPTGMVDVEMFPRTKSGRRVKPPLAWWMGQRILVDPVTDRLSIKCMTQKAETVLNHIALDVSRREKPRKHNTSHASKISDCKTEGSKLEKDVINIIKTSKKERLSKQVKSKVTCYSQKTDVKKVNKQKGNNPFVSVTDIKEKRKNNQSRKYDPFEISDSDDQSKIQKHSDNCRTKSDSVHSAETETEPEVHHRILRQRKCVNYRDCYNMNSVTSESGPKNFCVSEPKKKIKSHSQKPLVKMDKKHDKRHKQGSVTQLVEQYDEIEMAKNPNKLVTLPLQNYQARKWSKSEKQRLEKALWETNPDDPDFWNIVSKMVQTHTAAECQEFCLQEIPGVKDKKSRGKSSSVTANKDILARVGTLKRKKQLREFLDKQNDDYNADLFDSTPMRAKSLRKIPRLDDGDVIDVFNTVTPGLHHQTPNIRYAIPVRSTGKTPFASTISPWMEPVNRTHADQYITNVQKKKRKHVPKIQQTPSKSSESVSCQPVKTLFVSGDSRHNPFEGVESVEEEVEEEGEDYYWTDEMED